MTTDPTTLAREVIDRNHPAVEAALDAEARTDGPMSRDTAHYMLEHALPHLTAVTEENLARLRNTEAGRALMAEAWGKCQEHYAAEWEVYYHEDYFPSPEPMPAVVSRESVAAFMMRHWAKNLRSGSNPYLQETPDE